jgi:hypothetical protein
MNTTLAQCDTATKRSLNKSEGSGRVHMIYKGTHLGPHRASAPGEPPARITGTLQGSISHRQAAHVGQRWTGEWGSYNVEYALGLEIGTGNMAPRPYLRPTAQAEYPKLAGRIKRLFERGL